MPKKLFLLTLLILVSCNLNVLGVQAQNADPQGQIQPAGTVMLRRPQIVQSSVQYGGRPDMAYSVGGKSVNKQQYDAHVLLNEAVLLTRSNKNDEAEKKVLQSISLYDGFAEAHHLLGFLYAKTGNCQGAIAELTRSIQLNPALEASWLTLGGVYQSNGNMQEAIDAYGEFVKRFPQHPMADKARALVVALGKEKAMREKLMAEQAGVGAPIAGEGNKSSEQQSQGNSVGRDDYLAFMQFHGGFKRWPKSRIPVTVYIHDGSNIPGFRESMRTILMRSFLDWANASNGGISFNFVDSPKNASLECFWTNKSSDLKNPAEAGDARLFEDSNYIRRVEIWLLTQPMSKELALTDNYFRVICLHEIGHSLGLSGHTTNPEDIMFYSASFKDVWRELSGRDSRSITRLYQSDF